MHMARASTGILGLPRLALILMLIAGPILPYWFFKVEALALGQARTVP